MERDFMGLNFKVKVKEEEQVDQSSQNSGFLAMSSIPHEDKMHQHAMYNPSIIKQNPIIEAHFSKQMFASKPPVSGRIPAMNSHSVVPSNAFARCTSEPAELTIFYAGRVNVYNNISPGKAQTIMFMAANGCTTSDRPPSEVKVEASTPNYSNIRNVQTSRLETSLIPLATSILPSAVPLPQARKASLARFLEKRKERIRSSSPYLVNKSGEGTAESNAGSSATSVVDSSSMSMEKDVNL